MRWLRDNLDHLFMWMVGIILTVYAILFGIGMLAWVAGFVVALAMSMSLIRATIGVLLARMQARESEGAE